MFIFIPKENKLTFEVSPFISSGSLRKRLGSGLKNKVNTTLNNFCCCMCTHKFSKVHVKFTCRVSYDREQNIYSLFYVDYSQ